MTAWLNQLSPIMVITIVPVLSAIMSLALFKPSGIESVYLSFSFTINLAIFAMSTWAHRANHEKMTTKNGADLIFASLALMAQSFAELVLLTSNQAIIEVVLIYATSTGAIGFVFLKRIHQETTTGIKHLQASFIQYVPFALAIMYPIMYFPLRGWISRQQYIGHFIGINAVCLLGCIAYLFVIARSLAIKTPTKNLSKQLSPFALALVIICLQIIVWTVQILQSDAIGIGSFGISLISIYFFIEALRSIKDISEAHQEYYMAARLAEMPALRVLRRNLKSQNSWAATIGIRTTVFVVDHDPYLKVTQKMPATLLQIRNEEINRCIQDILKSEILHNQSLGQSFFGCIDPEFSSRSCLNVLKMFSCLYLDAGTIISRRMVGLSNLLPIINPGLSKALKSSNSNESQQDQSWFFYCDFQWVDQHILNTPNGTKYGVKLDSLPHELKRGIHNHLSKINGHGSFVWLGRDAVERLMQEAPMLRGIVEEAMITMSDQSTVPAFFIRFEKLIPRLQRYCDLDSLRKLLLDFDPSIESMKVLDLFQIQVNQARTSPTMMNVVDSVANYFWRGFKEKDLALNIVLQAHRFNQNLITIARQKGEEPPRSCIKLNETIQNAIEQIGYPSQLFHRAHIQKSALRDVKSLYRAASKPSDPRFLESWSLIATLDLTRYSQEDRTLLASFYGSTKTLPVSDSLLLMKSVDGIVGLGRADFINKQNCVDTSKCLLVVLDKAENEKIEATELLIGVVDCIHFLTELHGSLSFGFVEVVAKMEAMLRNSKDVSGPKIQGLLLRFNELKQLVIKSQSFAGEDEKTGLKKVV
jgi:hypothetical protein